MKMPHLPSFVYRLYDSEGTLLYVGKATGPYRLKHRLMAHSRKTWGDEIDRHETVEYDTEQDALDAEKVAIILEKPKYNVMTPGKLRLERRTEEPKVQINLPKEVHKHFKVQAIDDNVGLSNLLRSILIEVANEKKAEL